MAIQLPDGASLARTDAVVRQASTLIRETPGVENTVEFAGFSGATRSNSPNAGAIFVATKPFEERVAHGPTANELIAQLRKKLAAIPEAVIFVIPPPPVQGLGTSGGYKFLVQDRAGGTARALQEATDELVAKTRTDPALAAVFTTYRASTPQLFVDIDRYKAQMLQVPISNVFEALQVGLGSVYVNDFNALGRVFQVRAQAESEFRARPEQIPLLRTRNARGEMVPLGSVITVQWHSGPDRVVRYNMFPAAEVQGDSAPGHSTGEAMATIDRMAAEHLPPGSTIEWTDLAFQQRLAGNAALFIFPLCMLFVFLVHAAEYESWLLPLSIILIAPICLPFALLGVWYRGFDNNLITQIGFVVLVGLAAKNAVLIVEFAEQREAAGDDPRTAAIEACRMRLRPIVMTSLAFILGVLPLAIATGPGAEMRQVLGTAVLAGMLGVTVLGLFLTPAFYVVLQRSSHTAATLEGVAATAPAPDAPAPTGGPADAGS